MKNHPNGRRTGGGGLQTPPASFLDTFLLGHIEELALEVIFIKFEVILVMYIW